MLRESAHASTALAADCSARPDTEFIDVTGDGG
jgi:hypothetical protein